MSTFLKRMRPFLLLYVVAGTILGLSVGNKGDDEATLVAWIIIFLILIVNPIFLPKIWQFVLVRIREIAKAIRGTD